MLGAGTVLLGDCTEFGGNSDMFGQELQRAVKRLRKRERDRERNKGRLTVDNRKAWFQ